MVTTNNTHTAGDRPNSSWTQQQRNDYANRQNPNHPSYGTNSWSSANSSQRPPNPNNRGTGTNRGNGNTYSGRGTGSNRGGGNTFNGGNRGNRGHGNRGNRGGGQPNGNRNTNAEPPQKDWVGLMVNFVSLACDAYRAYDRYQNNNNRGRGRGRSNRW